MSNSGDYELLFCKFELQIQMDDWRFLGNIDKCRQITQPTLMKDVKWATYTCPIGFEALGIWPEGADGTDINAIDRFIQDNKLIRKKSRFYLKKS